MKAPCPSRGGSCGPIQEAPGPLFALHPQWHQGGCFVLVLGGRLEGVGGQGRGGQPVQGVEAVDAGVGARGGGDAHEAIAGSRGVRGHAGGGDALGGQQSWGAPRARPQVVLQLK